MNGPPREARPRPGPAADAARYGRRQEIRVGIAPAGPIQPRARRTEDRSPAPSPTAPLPRHPRRQATPPVRADGGPVPGRCGIDPVLTPSPAPARCGGRAAGVGEAGGVRGTAAARPCTPPASTHSYSERHPCHVHAAGTRRNKPHRSGERARIMCHSCHSARDWVSLHPSWGLLQFLASGRRGRRCRAPVPGFGPGACFAGGVWCPFWCCLGVLLLFTGML